MRMKKNLIKVEASRPRFICSIHIYIIRCNCVHNFYRYQLLNTGQDGTENGINAVIIVFIDSSIHDSTYFSQANFP